MWWWTRKKLERLNEELTVVTLLERLYASRTDLTQPDLSACAMRQRKRSQLLAEITRLDPNARPTSRRD
jgi:hypothetical protein